MPKCCALSLRHKLTLQSASQSSDGQGGFTESWNDTASLWASIEPVKGYERSQAMQMQTPVTHKLTLRYNADVTTDKRFLFGDRVFSIVEVINVEERQRWLIVKAIELQ